MDKITEYLCEPLRKCLKDEDPYVRKTAAVCVAKMHDINAQLVEDQGFLDLLRDLLSDSNPMVSSFINFTSFCLDVGFIPVTFYLQLFVFFIFIFYLGFSNNCLISLRLGIDRNVLLIGIILYNLFISLLLTGNHVFVHLFILLLSSAVYY